MRHAGEARGHRCLRPPEPAAVRIVARESGREFPAANFRKAGEIDRYRVATSATAGFRSAGAGREQRCKAGAGIGRFDRANGDFFAVLASCESAGAVAENRITVSGRRREQRAAPEFVRNGELVAARKAETENSGAQGTRYGGSGAGRGGECEQDGRVFRGYDAGSI